MLGIHPNFVLALMVYSKRSLATIIRNRSFDWKTQFIPAAVELNGRWGDGMFSLFALF